MLADASVTEFCCSGVNHIDYSIIEWEGNVGTLYMENVMLNF